MLSSSDIIGGTTGKGSTLLVDGPMSLGGTNGGASGLVLTHGRPLATPTNQVTVVPGDYDQTGS
jgi:hypothetical protein